MLKLENDMMSLTARALKPICQK